MKETPNEYIIKKVIANDEPDRHWYKQNASGETKAFSMANNLYHKYMWTIKKQIPNIISKLNVLRSRLRKDCGSDVFITGKSNVFMDVPSSICCWETFVKGCEICFGIDLEIHSTPCWVISRRAKGKT